MRLSWIILITTLLIACDKSSSQAEVKQDELSAQSQEKSNSDLSIYQFTRTDIRFLKQLSILQLGQPPISESNQYADNEAAAMLGKKLFFDKGLSKSGQFSCATCHQPQRYFTDALRYSKAAGTTARSAPSVLGAAYSPWQFWDGRKDSLWSQALGPIEDHNEMDSTRVEYVRLLLGKYSDSYQSVFGNLDLAFLKRLPAKASPLGDQDSQNEWSNMDDDLKDNINRIFSNSGKAMMAYQRRLQLPLSPFDRFVEALDESDPEEFEQKSSPAKIAHLTKILRPSAVAGLRLFVGKANCVSCHNGPLFTNHEFHNVGAPDVADKAVELGRYQGVQNLVADEFTCLSRWSDASENGCNEMRFLKTRGVELVGALKTPSLRNVAKTAPYMQFGQFANLQQVIAHYNKPTPPVYNRDQHPSRPHFDILPLNLSEQEQLDLESFLNSLTSPLPKDDRWWALDEAESSI